MSLRLALRLLLGLAASVFFVALPRPAHGQTLSIVTAESLPRLDANGSLIAKRSPDQQPEGVNLRDCLDDQRIRVPLVLTGFQAGGTLEAWASLPGADCSPASNRSGPAAACWKLAALPLIQTSTADLPVRAILGGALPAGPGDPADERRACGHVDRMTLGLQFLYFPQGQPYAATASARVELRVDTIGNPAVDGLSVLPGNERLVAQWSPLDAPYVSPVMNLYCAPSSGPDAGACTSPFAPGTFPTADFDARFLCATVVGNATSAAASTLNGAPLTNGIPYAVAVASVDDFGNVGALSPAVCAAPDAGGAADEPDGGASSCSTSPGPRGRAGLTGVAALALTALLAVQRRRRVTER